MPTSQPFQLNEIMYLIMQLNPASVLDIGAGFGKYGLLCREYLELWDGREKYDNWQRTIDAIEGFEKYITPVHKFIYNNVYLGNALEILPQINTDAYNLILLIDVLEHFDSSTDARTLLKECSRVAKHIIIATPKHPEKQTDSFGNPYETHRSIWTKKTLEKCLKSVNPDGSVIFYPNEYSIICLTTTNPITEETHLKKRFAFLSLKIFIKRYLPFAPFLYRKIRNILHLFNK